jgi:hypothetical protein
MIRPPYIKTIEKVISAHMQGQVINTNAVARQVSTRHPEVSPQRIREGVLEAAIRRGEAVEWEQDLQS